MSVAARMSEFWHLLRARLSLLADRRDRARFALKDALRRNPNSFVAHFLLGRVYLRDDVVVKAKREFDLAWQIDPERFERCYARLRAQQEGAPDLFTYTDSAGQGVHVTLRTGRARRYCGDFRDEEERRYFDSLPPITREEIGSIDWDSFENEIFGA